MDSINYPPRRGFWIATTFVIMVTVFAVVLLGAGPGSGSGLASELRLIIDLALIPGSCIGLFQSLILAFPSMWARIQWFSITVASTAIGWSIVFMIVALLERLHLSISVSDQLVSAAAVGFLTGALTGAVIGLVTGVIQGRIQRLSANYWIVSNVISWGIGIAIPLMVFVIWISQIRISF